jgi:hypothetical protein
VKTPGLWLDALGLHVRGRLGNGQQLRHLPGDTLRGLLVQPLLLGSAGLQLLGRLGEHPGFLLGVEGVALRLPLQVDAGLVVLDVAGRVAIQVADIEARSGFLAVLLAFDADAVLLAVHDRDARRSRHSRSSAAPRRTRPSASSPGLAGRGRSRASSA